MGTTPEGRRHNLDLSSLKPLPKGREVGSGVKKPESPSLMEAKTPEEAGEQAITVPGRMRPAVYGGLVRPSHRRRDNTQPINYYHKPVEVHAAQLQKDARLRPDSRNPKEIFRVFYGKPPEGEAPGDASKYLSDPHFSGFAKRGPMRPAVLEGLPQSRPNRQHKDENGSQRKP
jgi:hypothetical protein